MSPQILALDHSDGMKRAVVGRLAGVTVALLTMLLASFALDVSGPPAHAEEVAWEWPLRPQPQVLRGFEPPAGPYAPGHRGVDLAGAVKQPVLATAAGIVQYAGMVAGKGVVVVVHGEERSTYQPLSLSVHRGEAVSAGQLLGRLQLGGSHCWPQACLHLGRIAGETYLDPLALMTGGPIRLLPMHDTLPLDRRRGDLGLSAFGDRLPLGQVSMAASGAIAIGLQVGKSQARG